MCVLSISNRVTKLGTMAAAELASSCLVVFSAWISMLVNWEEKWRGGGQGVVVIEGWLLRLQLRGEHQNEKKIKRTWKRHRVAQSNSRNDERMKGFFLFFGGGGELWIGFNGRNEMISVDARAAFLTAAAGGSGARCGAVAPAVGGPQRNGRTANRRWSKLKRCRDRSDLSQQIGAARPLRV